MSGQWDLPSISIWLGLMGLAVAIIGAGWRMAGRGREPFGEFDVRHEVIDECFAKGEMTRTDCEEGYVAVGGRHAFASSPDASHPALDKSKSMNASHDLGDDAQQVVTSERLVERRVE